MPPGGLKRKTMGVGLKGIPRLLEGLLRGPLRPRPLALAGRVPRLVGRAWAFWAWASKAFPAASAAMASASPASPGLFPTSAASLASAATTRRGPPRPPPPPPGARPPGPASPCDEADAGLSRCRGFSGPVSRPPRVNTNIDVAGVFSGSTPLLARELEFFRIGFGAKHRDHFAIRQLFFCHFLHFLARCGAAVEAYVFPG